MLVERVFGLDFDVAPNGFWQAADGAAEFLVAHVLRAVDAVRVDRPQFVVDAYAGVGLFAAHIAHRGRPGDRVVAIEGDAGAVRAGRDNLARHAAPRVAVDMRDGDVARLLGAALPGADVVVLDPPRTGLDRSVSELLAERGPQRIVLIACDPAALARDLERLTLAGPYRVTSLVGADLFPQSHHVEVVAVLDRAV